MRQVVVEAESTPGGGAGRIVHGDAAGHTVGRRRRCFIGRATVVAVGRLLFLDEPAPLGACVLKPDLSVIKTKHEPSSLKSHTKTLCS